VSVVVSLLRAIDRADGDALVMHVGEKPYVVTASGHAELAANALSVPAMTGMLDQLLPADSRKALNELGAVEYHLPPDPVSPNVRYSVVAARGGNDIWIEVRRRKIVEEPVPVAVHQHTNAAVAVEEPPPPTSDAASITARDRYEYEAAPIEHLQRDAEPAEPMPTTFDRVEPFDGDEVGTVALAPEQAAPELEAAQRPDRVVPGPPEAPEALEDAGFELRTQSDDDFSPPDRVEENLDEGPMRFDELPPTFDFSVDLPVAVSELERTVARDAAPPAGRATAAPMARVNVRVEEPAPPIVHADPLHHLLYVAAGQGASALYVAPQARPSLRVDGEVRVLDEAPLTQEQLETSVRELLKVDASEPLPIGEIETREVSDVGRVQYLGFRDHRGLGATFRMLPGRAISAEQAGLSAAIQALCTEPEGLLLVAGGRSAGKSTLVAALVDQINRTRKDHVITVESEIQYVHGNRTSFISQREARDDDRFAEALRTAIREAPDVLVVDGAMNTDIASMALRAAADGHLVVASVTAVTTPAVLERFIGFLGQDTSEPREMLGEHLRGVVFQALLRKTGGGRAAAREVLVNVPSVASLVGAAHFDQIPAVLNSGRRVGMVPLNDALLGLVQNGALDVRQAYRKSPYQGELLDMLNKAGFDTSFAENLKIQ
jgi:twitching motility protein PilT